MDNDEEHFFSLVAVFQRNFSVNKNKSKRQHTDTDTNAFVGILPSGVTTSTAVLRAEGGWPCVDRKMNMSAQVRCPTSSHFSFHCMGISPKCAVESWLPPTYHGGTLCS